MTPVTAGGAWHRPSAGPWVNEISGGWCLTVPRGICCVIRTCARQHQVAEVACYRLREDTGRVHRPPQKHPVSVLEFAKKNTMRMSHRMSHRTYNHRILDDPCRPIARASTLPRTILRPRVPANILRAWGWELNATFSRLAVGTWAPCKVCQPFVVVVDTGDRVPCPRRSQRPGTCLAELQAKPSRNMARASVVQFV